MTDLINEYVGETTWRMKSNANAGKSLSGLQSHISGTIMAKDALKRLGMLGKKHIDGDYHLHDLSGGIYAPYCSGNDLLGLLQKGLINVGNVAAKPPKHFTTALDQMTNFTFLMTGEFQGAQAWINPDILLAPYIHNDKLTYDEVKQELQQFIWNLSFSLRPGFQSVFSNLTFGLRPSKYYENLPVNIGGKLLGNTTYTDYQDEIDLFNQAFIDTMIEGPGEGKMFTFPLPTYNITKDFDWNSEISNSIFDLAAKWGSPYFSNYVGTDLSEDDNLSMCPLAGSEYILHKSSRYSRLEYSQIKNLEPSKKYNIFSDGEFIEGIFNRYDNQEMIEITLCNHHKIKMSENHLNYIIENNCENTVKGKDLNTNMYLPYSLNSYEGNGGNKDLGFIVGAFAGDGSFDQSSVVFSLNQEGKKNNFVKDEIIRICQKYFGAGYSLTPDLKTKLLTLRINSKAVVGLCKEFVIGKQREKCYSPKIFEMSLEFREGIIDGHRYTDGGFRGRIHTSSMNMVRSLNMLAASMGTTTSVLKDDRPNRLGTEPNYAVNIYKLNREKYDGFWFKSNDKLWVKIKSIKPIKGNIAYCFEVINNKPIFTVGTTGILTHNCRLRLDMKEVQKVSGGIWNIGSNTGSLAVFTINLPRIGYISNGNEKKFYRILDQMLNNGKKYLLRKKEFIKEGMNNGLFPMISEYIGNKLFKTYFLTIGINGMNECSMNFCEQDIIENVKWCDEVSKYIKNKVLQFQIESGHLFNYEATPAEGASYSLAKTDVEKYPDIFTQGNKDQVYYTGSTLIPMNYDIDLVTALDHQNLLQSNYTGGTVFHIDIGELGNRDSIKEIIKKTCENTQLPYVTWSPSYSICPDHGRTAGKGCCEKSETYTRVVGYLRPVQKFNKGKKMEFDEKIFMK